MPDFDCNDPLTRCWHAEIDRQQGGDTRAPFQTSKSSRCQHECIIVAGVQFPEPRIEVPSNREEPAGRRECRKLRDSPYAARADPGCTAQLPSHEIEFLLGILSCRQHERVARILSREHAGDFQSFRKERWHVLAAVDGEVYVAGKEGVLDFLDEESLASDLRQRRFTQAIAGCLDDDDLALRSGVGGKEAGDGIGLIERKRAATGADPESQIHGF